MFNSTEYTAMYKRFMGPLAQPIIALINNGTDFDPYNLTAHVSRYDESELVSGGTILIGDLRLIILAADLTAAGLTTLGLKDRIVIDNRTYSIIHWDQYSRTIGDEGVAVEATIRGGGVYQ